MRSNAEDLASAVLSPKRTIPEPAWNTTGLILLEYRTSLCSFDGLYVSLTALRMAPLAVPAGENQGKLLMSVLTHVHGAKKLRTLLVISTSLLTVTEPAEESLMNAPL